MLLYSERLLELSGFQQLFDNVQAPDQLTLGIHLHSPTVMPLSRTLATRHSVRHTLTGLITNAPPASQTTALASSERVSVSSGSRLSYLSLLSLDCGLR